MFNIVVAAAWHSCEFEKPIQIKLSALSIYKNNRNINK
jgi:hypothetical protein